MEVLISGLNSYLGRRAAGHLNREDFHVHGIVRDLTLFKSRMFEEPTASLDKVDLLRKGAEYDAFRVGPAVGLGYLHIACPYVGRSCKPESGARYVEELY